jgi:hypothetical protein
MKPRGKMVMAVVYDLSFAFQQPRGEVRKLVGLRSHLATE